MNATRHGPSHPLAIACTFVLLLNDFVLKAWVPGAVTGKLSDVTWLVVAPVVAAALLVRIGVAERAARGGALVAVAIAFVLLQLWPPLGETWVAFTGGHHVADAEDLVALPALALVRLCWRSPRRRRLALPVAAVACLATDMGPCASGRIPGDGATHDANTPLVIGLGWFGSAPHDTEDVAGSVRLTDADGSDVPFVMASNGNMLWICPIGGLESGSSYTWTIDPIDPASANHLPSSRLPLGTTTFVTSEIPSDLVPATDEPSCRELANAEAGSFVCVGIDTGVDTGFVDTASADTDTDPP